MSVCISFHGIFNPDNNPLWIGLAPHQLRVTSQSTGWLIKSWCENSSLSIRTLFSPHFFTCLLESWCWLNNSTQEGVLLSWMLSLVLRSSRRSQRRSWRASYSFCFRLNSVSDTSIWSWDLSDTCRCPRLTAIGRRHEHGELLNSTSCSSCSVSYYVNYKRRRTAGALPSRGFSKSEWVKWRSD